MDQKFAIILTEGGHTNSLGRAEDVVRVVLADKNRLEELYQCMFDDDAWVRMRAADSLEKVCRVKPEWFKPYASRFISELSDSTQPSIQWHLAQMYRQIDLTDEERRIVINWLKQLIASIDVDWIVSANVMETLLHLSNADHIDKSEIQSLFEIQRQHKSKSVVRKANKLLDQIK